MNKSGFLFLIIAIGIALLVTWLNTYWLSYSDLKFKQKIKKIDYYLSDFTLLVTEPDGNMRYHVKAQHLVHQQSTGASHIYKPLLEVIDSDGGPIIIHAGKAQQLTKNGAIQLIEDVSINKQSDDPKKKFNIVMNDLTYNPEKQTLTSDSELSITTGWGIMNGVGLSSNLEQQELRILSNVHAEYVPSKQ